MTTTKRQPSKRMQDLYDTMIKAMNDVQDDISLYYDYAYSDDVALGILKDDLDEARRRRNLFFEAERMYEELNQRYENFVNDLTNEGLSEQATPKAFITTVYGHEEHIALTRETMRDFLEGKQVHDAEINSLIEYLYQYE